ncbi:MAG TPA: hypothetical protein VM889_09540 [Candidatus Thermoplasmatota archaeon]|nr:hypothetical protein [Candidatus Thermoplasmatota archaeon]
MASGTSKKMQTFDDDDIVRFSMGLDVPIVGLVRNRDEYKEMREIALIYGLALGLNGRRGPAPQAATPPAANAPRAAAIAPAPAPATDDPPSA